MHNNRDTGWMMAETDQTAEGGGDFQVDDRGGSLDGDGECRPDYNNRIGADLLTMKDTDWTGNAH